LPAQIFTEAQSRLQDLVRQLNNCKAQIFQRDRNSRMGEITLKELDNIKQQPQQDSDIITYKGVGKMYATYNVVLYRQL
jgi:hypothetical protein